MLNKIFRHFVFLLLLIQIHILCKKKKKNVFDKLLNSGCILQRKNNEKTIFLKNIFRLNTIFAEFYIKKWPHFTGFELFSYLLSLNK